MIDLKTYLEIVKNKFHAFWACLLMIVTTLLLFALIDSLFSRLGLYRFIGYGIIFVAESVFWAFFRWRLPRNAKNKVGISCESGGIQIPVKIKNKEQFKMSYQHDLIIRNNEDIKIIGFVKTSSKHRIDKIFIDKFLHNKLTGVNTPHIAIFLNDVQRKKTKKENQYRRNATFLPGHFKGYTIKLNPLDGAYYYDIRPNMKTDTLLKKYIKTFDSLICEDLWKFL